ncbi:MAG: hypothetical protein IIB77_11320 [Proteobacteria bacterium]|nr:hypothetical protein [Pseudomonadota bacterium]
MLKLTIEAENYAELTSNVCALAADMKFPGSGGTATVPATSGTGGTSAVVETAAELAAT